MTDSARTFPVMVYLTKSEKERLRQFAFDINERMAECLRSAFFHMLDKVEKGEIEAKSGKPEIVKLPSIGTFWQLSEFAPDIMRVESISPSSIYVSLYGRNRQRRAYNTVEVPIPIDEFLANYVCLDQQDADEKTT